MPELCCYLINGRNWFGPPKVTQEKHKVVVLYSNLVIFIRVPKYYYRVLKHKFLLMEGIEKIMCKMYKSSIKNSMLLIKHVKFL